MNERIDAPRVLLIGAEGEQVGVVSIEQARQAAADAQMDLVEVGPDADPPVCKLMDFGKYKYKLKRKTHQSKTKSHVTHIKEIRLHPKTSQHDIDYRLEHAREFLSKGDKVLVTVVFKGREMAHVEIGDELLQKVADQLADCTKIEVGAKRTGRRMSMLLAPK